MTWGYITQMYYQAPITLGNKYIYLIIVWLGSPQVFLSNRSRYCLIIFKYPGRSFEVRKSLLILEISWSPSVLFSSFRTPEHKMASTRIVISQLLLFICITSRCNVLAVPLMERADCTDASSCADLHIDNAPYNSLLMEYDPTPPPLAKRRRFLPKNPYEDFVEYYSSSWYISLYVFRSR